MKKKQFTLVELMVVIAIIIILAGILIPVVAGALGKADKTKATAEMTTLVNAIKQFEATYGFLPTFYYNGSTKTDLIDSDGVVESSKYEKLILILQNEEESTKKVNVKKQIFLDVQGNTAGTYKDPWDNDYGVAMATDNSGKITNVEIPGIKGDGSGGKVDKLYRSVAVWSLGDNTNETNGSEDNLYSFPVNWNAGEKKYNVAP